jgi:ubiquinol-cytochrome c reductase iron-sulfur subunit
MSESIDKGRRQLLTAATTLTGAVGVAFAAVPFLSSWKPSARAKALGAPVEIDISKLDLGAMLKIEWRGKPVWVVRRTPEQLAELPKLEPQLADPKSKRNPDELTPEYARNDNRSLKPEYLVVVGICTHLGCSPIDKFVSGAQASLPEDWKGGFLCPCHGSTFDMAGRVYKDKPAPDNLEVPPHMYLSDSRLLIGEAKQA